MASKDVNIFLRSHKGFSRSGNKIVCKMTGHEMPPSLEVLEKYVAGKKYKHALEWYSFDFGKYKANYIFPGRDGKTLYCQVTRMTLNKIPSEVDNHINGKRYQQELKRYEAKLERTKAANAKRDAKVREASEKGWVLKDKSNPVKEQGSDDERVDMSALGEISKPQKSKKAWYDDLSDLNPGLNRDARSTNEDEVEYADGHPIMEFLARIAASDSEESDQMDMDGPDDSDEEKAPFKPSNKSKSSERSSKSESKPPKEAKESRKSRKSGEKKKSALAESIEENMKPKFKSMKESSREKKEKRDKLRSRSKESK